MKWCFVMLVIIVVIIGLIPFEKRIDDGWWTLSVVVRSSTNRFIKGFSIEPINSVDYVRELLDNPPPLALDATRLDRSRFANVQKPYTGQPIEVQISNSDTIDRSLLFTWRSYAQQRFLFVIIEYEGGKTVARAVEIPDLRHDRSVTIKVP